MTKLELVAQAAFLLVGRGVVPMAVQADLAERHGFGMLEHILD